MKRIFALPLLMALFSISKAQSITDGDLNNWSLHTFNGGTYYEPLNGWLMTLNKLADVPYPIGPGPVTTERVTDVQAGAYAAKMISKEFIVGINHLFIPGAVGTLNVDIVAQIAKVGRPYNYSERPRHFKGFFKYEPVNGDSCLLLTLITKYNPTLHQRDTIAIGRKTYNSTYSTYTPFNVDIIYKDTITLPDTITIFAASSAFLNFANLQACHGQLNSTMWVDELSFSMIYGIEMPINPLVNVTVFPNPAINNISFSTGKLIKNGIIELYDINGKYITKTSFDGSSLMMDVSNYAAGKYFYKLSDRKTLLNSGSFIVKN